MLEKTISKINKEFINEAKGSPQLLEDMAAMEKYMAENYSERVLIELLQNADDAKSKTVKILLNKDVMFFANDGRPFNEDDVLAISRAGHSLKERGKDIGYRGIGFKSTTSITDEIIIYSNDTYFSFSREKCSKILGIDKNKIPTIRIPFNVKNEEVQTNIQETIKKLKQEGFTTIFVFERTKLSKILTELSDFSTSYLIFIENINKLIIETENIKEKYIVERITNKNEQNISISYNEKKEEWLIIKGGASTSIAFKIENGKIINCSKDEAVFHCYLPTKDYSPYLLKINGDFSTDPSRKHIKDDEINNKILLEAVNLLFEYIKNIFNNINNARNEKIFNVLQLADFSKYSILFDKLIKDKINAMNIKTNNGAINIRSYKTFNDNFENFDIICIRKNSKYVKEMSVKPELYEQINGLENFLKNYSISQFEIDDFIKILQEKDFVLNCNASTLSQIYTTLIKKARTAVLLQKISINFKDCYIITQNGIKLLSKIGLYDDIQFELRNFLKEKLSELELNWFLNYNNIANDKTIIKNDETKINSQENIEKVETEIIVSKWRSAEKQCVEIEEYLGNKAIDVSIKNLGYDVESVTPTGQKRYIEVKFLSSYGSAFSMTNNEYTSAHQLADNYYLCLISKTNNKLKAVYIRNPLKNIHLEKRIRQWEWYCEKYEGEEISLTLK